MANPRSLLSQMSESVPPASVKGADAKKPAKKRQMSSVWILFAKAQGILKTASRGSGSGRILMRERRSGTH